MTPDMTAHTVRCHDYVNHPYPRVRDALLANPNRVFRQATALAAVDAAALHVRIGAIDVSSDVDILVTDVRHDVAYGRPSTQLSLAWAAVRNPGMFPTMHARLTMFALTATETQLELDGTYDPPLGPIGDLFDAALGHRLAEASIRRFVAEVAGWLRGELAAPGQGPAMPATGAGAGCCAAITPVTADSGK
jgi:hypothetical protein